MLRAAKESLATIVEVFIHDPLYKWALSPAAAQLRQGGSQPVRPPRPCVFANLKPNTLMDPLNKRALWPQPPRSCARAAASPWTTPASLRVHKPGTQIQ